MINIDRLYMLLDNAKDAENVVSYPGKVVLEFEPTIFFDEKRVETVTITADGIVTRTWKTYGRFTGTFYSEYSTAYSLNEQAR